MTVFIETKRLIINTPEPSDFDHLLELGSDPEVMQYVGNGGIRSPKEIREKQEQAIRHYQKHKFSAGNVYEKFTGEFVGRAGLFYLEFDDTQPEIEVGYTLHKKFWGLGYATELATAIVDWGFSNLLVDKLIGITYPENIGSQRVLEKAGMKYVGMSHSYNKDVRKYEIYRI